MSKGSRNQIFAILVFGALAAGCAKSASTSSDRSTAAATTQAMPADTASAAGAAAAASVAPVASDAAGTAGYTPIVLPVYPGAIKAPDRSAKINEGTYTLDATYYDSKDPGPQIAAWYQTHLPSSWSSIIGEPGKKIAGTFTSPGDGDLGQAVQVTSGNGDTEILLSTKTANK